MAHVPVNTVADLGTALRAVRMSQGVRLDDMAGAAGLSHVFAANVEHGKESVHFGKVLQLLREAGLMLSVDVPEQALAEMQRLRTKAESSPPPAQRSKK